MNKLIGMMLVGVLLFGAEYGRITGRVVDAETGTPLIGADVMVEGTDLGAASDENGDFVVLYVPAGTYRVTSSYISYDPLSLANVVVNAELTTVLNFRLPPTVIEVKGVTAVAERDAIVRILGTADLFLSSSSRWIRHPSLSEPGAAFQELPAGMDVDPAGGVIGPAPELLVGGLRNRLIVRQEP